MIMMKFVGKGGSGFGGGGNHGGPKGEKAINPTSKYSSFRSAGSFLNQSVFLIRFFSTKGTFWAAAP